MLLKETKKSVVGEFYALLDKYGVPEKPPMTEVYEQVFYFSFSRDISNAHIRGLEKVYDEMNKRKDLDNGCSLFFLPVEPEKRPLRGWEHIELWFAGVPGTWERTDVEDAKDAEDDRREADPEFDRQCKEREMAEKRKVWRDYIIPIPPAGAKKSTEVYLPLANNPYDAIKAGKKRTEYREYNDNWVKRLLANPPKTVKFQRGYGGKGRSAPEQMVCPVLGIRLVEEDYGRSCDPFNLDDSNPVVPAFIALDIGDPSPVSAR